MKRFLILAITVQFAMLISCSGTKEENSSSAIDEAVMQLETKEEKKQYLLAVRENDQAIRHGNKGAYLKVQYGENSQEYQDYIRQVMVQDEENLLKIQSYLATHGYPNWLEVGYEAAQTPWLVIHHSTDVALRNSYFKQFYVAYRRGNLDVNNLALYLGRTYEMVNGELLTIEGPYTVGQQIDSLVSALNLTGKRNRAEEIVRNDTFR